MIAGNVPKHLTIGARTGFLDAMRAESYPWQRIAMQFNMSAASQELVDLGAAPMPVETRDGVTVQDYIEKNIAVSPKDWDITVWISQNAIDDDQTGQLETKVRQAGRNFQKHISKEVFTALNSGDGTTYGLCYDGQDFFDSDHTDPGGDYQTNQDNEGASVLTLDAFETALVAARKFVDDRGEYVDYNYDLLVVPPDLERIAAQITMNTEAYDTANREMNPYSGRFAYVTSPYLDSTAWHIIASSEPIKPLILAMKKQPALQSAWFDPAAADGGKYYFKFYARYDVFYGDWRLAYQGNT